MRSVFLLALLMTTAFAGCTAPDDGDSGDADRYLGTCPAWTSGPGGGSVTSVFHPNSTRNEQVDQVGATVPHQRGGRDLDRFVLHFSNLTVLDGRLEARAFRGDTTQQLMLRDLRHQPASQVVPRLAFDNGEHGAFEVFVDLAPADGDTQPSAVRLEWTLQRDADGDPSTPSGAGFQYEVVAWYRVCGLP